MITEHINISNFKSIKNLSLTDCRRINLLIGPPNVGKSNIIEALSLFDIPFMGTKKLFDDIFKPLMRIDRPQQLFSYGDYQSPVKIETSSQSLRLTLKTNSLRPEFDIQIKRNEKTIFNLDSPIIGLKEVPEILVYYYPRQMKYYRSGLNFLRPPYGGNLMQIIETYPELSDELKSILSHYGLKRVFDSADEQFKAMKQDENEKIYMIPFRGLADSIKHLMFYKAAIAGNSNKIICFEEPESNTFPPFITKITDAILADKKNQYFITTHSPYVINDILEKKEDGVAIYKIGFSEGFTTAYRLNEEEIQAAYDYGMDLLFNIDAFPFEK